MKRGKRVLALVLAVLMLSGTTVQAEEIADEPIDMRLNTWLSTEEEREGKTTDEIVALETAKEEASTQKAYEMTIATNGMEEWPQGPGTYGEAAIVMEKQSGAILYAKNIDGKGYPASITKILTALVALENAELDDEISFTEDCVSILGNGYAHIGMTPGEKISLEDALYALLLASANEVAYAIGESVGEIAGGSDGNGYEWFLEEMNRRAKELGAVNSNFLNTNGIQEEEHYTTARDMALITRELFKNHKEFEEISQTLEYTIPPTNQCNESRTFQQVHQMFYDWNENYYPNAVAGKTGYTDEAMNTLVTCADNGEMELIAVVLKTHGKHVYTDTQAILDYGFENFEKIDLAKNEESKDIGKFEEGACVVLPKGVAFEDLKKEITPDEEDKTKGTITYTWENNPVGSAEITFSQEYLDEHGIKITMNEEKTNTEAKGFPWKKIILAVVIVIIVLFVFLAVLVARARKRKREALRRKRRRQQMQRRRMEGNGQRRQNDRQSIDRRQMERRRRDSIQHGRRYQDGNYSKR